MRIAGFSPLLALATLLVEPGYTSAATVDFARDVAPLLRTRCGSCHSASTTKSSGFSVDTLQSVLAGGKKHGRAVVGAHPEKSPLLLLIRGDLAPRMPISGELAKADVDRIEAWIRSLPEEEASKQEWRWPFEKPAAAPPPTVANTGWARNGVDAFILQRLEAQKLAPAPEASRRTLARRVYYDLIGLPPTAAEMQAFLDDRSPQAYEMLVEKLLADPRYGERWGRHWLDLVRYGETSGLEGDGMIGNAWRYRDWVIQAFNDDMPYDRFVIQQLAGADEHSKTRNNYQPNPQGHIPLGFLRVAPWDRSNLVADEVRQNYLSEVTTVTGSVFLGLSVGCARCHDHKYDPIPQRDYYRMQAFFNAIQVENVEVPYANPEFREQAEAKIKQLQAQLKDGPERQALNALEKQMRVKLIEARKAAATSKLTRDDLRLELKRGKDSMFSTGEQRKYSALLEDANRTLDPEERQALDAYEAELLARLRPYPERFDSISIEDTRAELSRQTSKYFTAEERNRYRDLAESVEVLRRRLGRWSPVALTVKNVPGPPNGPAIAPTRVLTRGDYRQPADPVDPGFLTCLTGKPEEAAVIEQDRYRQYPTRGLRMTLAKWIASPDNPLTARVMVNRIWQHHFGQGIVATPSDFGVNGERPTHPELLDWLAHRFIDSGWSIKAMHRLMLTSATYRQASENAKFNSNTADAENKLLWRFPRRRLEAEEIRDSVLYISGRLNPERQGPSVFPPLPSDLADFARYGRGGALMWEPNEREEDARRRSVYIFHRRSMPLPMMAAFDAPVFSESCERRSITTTPLQALSMMNGYLVQEEAVHLAKRIEGEAPQAGRPAHIARAFEIALQRQPTAEEAARFAAFAGGLDAICRVLLNTNEFLYLD